MQHYGKLGFFRPSLILALLSNHIGLINILQKAYDLCLIQCQPPGPDLAQTSNHIDSSSSWA